MSTSKEYLNYVLEQLSETEEITYRAMMGEYLIYYRDKVAGGLYDNRLLVKPTEAAKALMPTVSYELPYQGAKEMLSIGDAIEDKEFLARLFRAMYDELPAPKPKKKKQG